MLFMEDNEIAEWLRAHGIECEIATWDLRLPDMKYRYRARYAQGMRSGREPDRK